MQKKLISIPVAAIIAILMISLIGAESPILKVDDIRPGMKGYGLTVFNGTEPERFDVEVIDVMKRALPKQDIILVKVAGHDLENSGIYQGMSGSPIFIDGKIMGALAYGWSFMKAPIAGITPIESMLAELDRPSSPKNIAKSDSDKIAALPYKEGQLVPVASPVMVSGFSPSMMKNISDILEPYNLVPMQGGGAATTGTAKIELKPGSAVGVQLVRGDMEMSAIGTVTWTQGSKVLAFGHPFFQGGNIDFPMFGAKIIALFPRLSISSKAGIVTEEVGSLVQDRQSCVIGDIAQRTKMIPFDITVKNNRTGRVETVKTEMAWETSLSTKLIYMVLEQALSYVEAVSHENTAETILEVKFKGYKPLVMKNSYFNGTQAFNKQMLDPVVKLVYNPFEEVEIESMKVTVNVDPTIKIAFVKRLWMEEDEIEPGGVGHLHVVLAPFESKDIEKVFEVPVPQDAEPGTPLFVGAIGGMSIFPPVAPPVDFMGLLDIFDQLYKNTDLVVVQQMTSTGALVEGFAMSDLPPSAVRMFAAPNSVGPIIQSDLKMTPLATDWVILGKGALQVKVASR